MAKSPEQEFTEIQKRRDRLQMAKTHLEASRAALKEAERQFMAARRKYGGMGLYPGYEKDIPMVEKKIKDITLLLDHLRARQVVILKESRNG